MALSKESFALKINFFQLLLKNPLDFINKMNEKKIHQITIAYDPDIS